MALFRDENVGRRWGAEYFPGAHRLEAVEYLKKGELEVAVAVPPTASSPSPEVPLPPAPIPQTKADLAAASDEEREINFSGDPDLRDHDEAAIPKSVKRRMKAKKGSVQ